MNLELAGRVALVTGASVGIGKGICECLAEERVQLVITARRSDLLNRVADTIESKGLPQPHVIPQDLTRPNAAVLLRDEILSTFGRRGFVKRCVNSHQAASLPSLAHLAALLGRAGHSF